MNGAIFLRFLFFVDWDDFSGWRVWGSDCLVFNKVLERLEDRLFWEVLRRLGKLGNGLAST